MPAPPQLRAALTFSTAILLGITAIWIFTIQSFPPPPTSPNPSAPRPQAILHSSINESRALDFLLQNADASTAETRSALARELRAHLNQPGLRADELVFSFKDADAYQRFLARAVGIEFLGRLDALNTLRIRISDYSVFVGELVPHLDAHATISPNPILATPTPLREDRAARLSAPVGDNLLATLGLAPATDTSTWGRGVLIAVLDGGALPDTTLGSRLRYRDIGYGVTSLGADGAHGTSVAAIAAGSAPDARGVAPAADLLSIRVTGSDGASDTFSVAQGIHAAIDAGARVINISLGGYATAPVLTDAVERALSADVAIVASSGNDQTSALVWPAAYEGVVSVGATDAVGTQALFSNSGPSLQLTAPGVSITTAGASGTRTSFSGTSASAPVVSGSIAAVLSQSPGLTALEAADTLAAHSNDGGPAGTDPDYGRGTVNLGWTMARSDPDRIDPAVSSQNYNAADQTLAIVVQNRGAQYVTGLKLDVQAGGANSTLPVPGLAPGASTTLTVPVDQSHTSSGGSLRINSHLRVPSTLSDQNTHNNRHSGVLTLHSP